MINKTCPKLLREVPWDLTGPKSEHQCSYDNDKHDGKHYCGCGYEWTTVEAIIASHPDNN